MSSRTTDSPSSPFNASNELDGAYPLRPLTSTSTMSTGRSSPAPSYHSQTETGFAAFRSRTTRSRFSRFGQNNARDSDEQQGLLQDSDDDAAGRSTGSKRPSLASRPSEDHRRQYGTHADSDGLAPPSTTVVQLGSRRAGFIASLFAPKERSQRDLSRTIRLGDSDRVRSKYPANVVRNQKYNIVTFLPKVLYEQFKFFFNLYFLLVALSQFIPALKIGFIATYVAPLAFVLCITIGKEAIDDWARYKRDVESNSAPYKLLVPNNSALAKVQARLARKASSNKPLSLGSDLGQSRVVQVPSSKIKVGDLVVLDKNQRVPADMVLLQTFSNDATIETGHDSAAPTPADDSTQFVLGDDEDEGEDNIKSADSSAPEVGESHEAEGSNGSCFIRTDQLDGETDWKLRVAVELTQRMPTDDLAVLRDRAVVFAGPPIKDIHSFLGNLTLHPPPDDGSVTPPPTLPRSGPTVGDLLGVPADAPRSEPRLGRITTPRHNHCHESATASGSSDSRECLVGQHCPRRRDSRRNGRLYRTRDQSRHEHVLSRHQSRPVGSRDQSPLKDSLWCHLCALSCSRGTQWF